MQMAVVRTFCLAINTSPIVVYAELCLKRKITSTKLGSQHSTLGLKYVQTKRHLLQRENDNDVLDSLHGDQS